MEKIDMDCTLRKSFACLVGSLLLITSSEAAFYRCENAGTVLYQALPCNIGKQKEVEIQEMSVGSFDTRRSLGKTASKSRPKKKKRKKAQKKQASEKACWSKSRQLDDVSNHLRRGYAPAEGKRLKDRRRKYQDYLRTFCR